MSFRFVYENKGNIRGDKVNGLGHRNDTQSVKGASGLEIRSKEWKSRTGENPDLGAKFCYEIADAMLLEREKSNA